MQVEPPFRMFGRTIAPPSEHLFDMINLLVPTRSALPASIRDRRKQVWQNHTDVIRDGAGGEKSAATFGAARENGSERCRCEHQAGLGQSCVSGSADPG